MSPLNEKNASYSKVQEVPAPVLTITRPTATRNTSSNHYFSTIDEMDDTPPSTSHNEKFPSPYLSTVKTATDSKQNINKNSFDCDMEAGLSVQRTDAGISKTSLIKSKSCGAEQWPNRFVEQKKMKRERRRDRACCACWGEMSKKQRTLVLTVVFLLVVGAAIGVGVGVSKRVGGGVVTKEGTNTPLPH
jgi:hypothetical protein